MSDVMRYLGTTAGVLTIGAAAAGAAAYVAMKPQPVDILLDLNNQSKPVKDEEHVRMSVLQDQLVEYVFDDVRTFYEAFQRGARESNNGPCLGWRPSPKHPYCWITYNDVLTKAKDTGAGFIANGLKPDNGVRIGIYSQNRVEYIVTELACYTYSMVIVPLYDTLGPDACTFIINQAKIELVVCDKNTKVKSLLAHMSHTPNLRVIVCVEPPTEENMASAKSAGVELMAFTALEELGKSSPQPIKPCKPTDLSTICYTSGTTGTPKGAMITHRNIIAVVSSIQIQIQNLNAGPQDILISYLPLAHAYERINECFMYMVGGRVGFYQGDVRLLKSDMEELKPTVFPTVPRLLNRMYDKVLASVNPSRVKRFLFNWGLSSKIAELERGIIRNDSFWDKLVFREVQKGMGGSVRLITTGSAPCSSKVLSFTRAAMGCPVLEGYGQTESTAVSSLQVGGDPSTGHVGSPLACNMFKLVDVPEMDYFTSNMQGEVCIKGASVFKGYLNMEDQPIDKDGWLHTGDIGTWLPNGTMKIIDRKKNIFKLSQGEYIAPEKIENIYVRSGPVAQVFVHGDSFKSCLVAVVVPDPDYMPKWVRKQIGIEGQTAQELCNNKEVKKAILADMVGLGKQAGLLSFEQVKDIYFAPEMFSVENGLLTPTFKSKRNEILKHFSTEIDEMYKHLQ